MLFQKRVVHTKFDIYVLIYDVIIIKAKKINLTNLIL
jgi:hypothetical protein